MVGDMQKDRKDLGGHDHDMRKNPIFNKRKKRQALPLSKHS